MCVDAAKKFGRTELTDEEWERIHPIIRKIKGVHAGMPFRCRLFVNAVLWVLRVGGQWRELPVERGNWNSVFKRYSRWSERGVWSRILEELAKAADQQEVLIDSTVARAHACAAGAAGSFAEQEALGRSRGGFGCKIHAAADALGMPIKFILTGGQEADVKQAVPLMQGLTAQACLADKAYDSDEFTEWLETRSIEIVIPPKSNRKEPRKCDFRRYRERHLIECMFGKLKYFRRVATRYEKTAVNYMGMLSFAAALLWLR